MPYPEDDLELERLRQSLAPSVSGPAAYSALQTGPLAQGLGTIQANLGPSAEMLGSRIGSAWQQTPQAAFLESLKQRLGGILKSPLGQAVGQEAPKVAENIFKAYQFTPPGMATKLAMDLPKLMVPTETLEQSRGAVPIEDIRTRAIERKLHEETPEASAAKAAAETEIGDYPGKASVLNRTGLPQPPKPVMNVTVNGQTYDYSDPSVRAPKLTGDFTSLYETGADYTKGPKTVRTLPSDQRPGVSIMDPHGTQLADLARQRELAEAQRATKLAQMSPEAALRLDPRVAAEVVKAQRPSDVQYAAAEYERLWARSQEVGRQAVQQAIQNDPKFAAAAQFAAKDPQAAQDFATKAQAIAAAAQTQFLQAGSATLGRDPYRPEQSYGQ